MKNTDESPFIGGRWSPADGGKTYTCLDPYTGETATRASAAGTHDVERAVQAAQGAFAPWAACTACAG
ncbi:aldehyde dehydrogenase family protein [Phaeobacter sp. G2]|nr:aldehyde dehydrogenase family protein [Phaeobacter sp. G2]